MPPTDIGTDTQRDEQTDEANKHQKNIPLTQQLSRLVDGEIRRSNRVPSLRLPLSESFSIYIRLLRALPYSHSSSLSRFVHVLSPQYSWRHLPNLSPIPPYSRPQRPCPRLPLARSLSFSSSLEERCPQQYREHYRGTAMIKAFCVVLICFY